MTHFKVIITAHKKTFSDKIRNYTHSQVNTKGNKQYSSNLSAQTTNYIGATGLENLCFNH